jgi:DNA ligase (NAD+)
MPKVQEFITNLKKISREELLEIEGFGSILTDNFIDFIKSSKPDDLISSFDKSELVSGKTVEVISLIRNEGSLTGQVICITGSFDISRQVIWQLLEDKGATVVSTITKKTTLMLAGDEAGSKLEKARKQNIKIITSYKELIN